jgi:hypothetical protein
VLVVISGVWWAELNTRAQRGRHFFHTDLDKKQVSLTMNAPLVDSGGNVELIA